jgi:hypothetical protein
LKQRWEQQRQQLETHGRAHTNTTNITSTKPQAASTATQEWQQQQLLETRHVSSHSYVFFTSFFISLH